MPPMTRYRGREMKRHGRGSSACVVSLPRPAESQVEPTLQNWGHGRERGRSPGFRIVLGPTLPRLFAQWICRTLSPVTVAGAAPVLHRLPYGAFFTDFGGKAALDRVTGPVE